MSTHIAAQKGEIADTVLLPGDPLRAKYIAETFLENAECYNTIRNAFGYTGTYKGKRVSVQATGMGIPSISIYTNELINEYGVKTLIRVGTCGGMSLIFTFGTSSLPKEQVRILPLLEIRLVGIFITLR
ncbi:purine nucleoside phosphorylase [Pediococcus acidilactici NGRI 0510Q]|nr:purine nucleoside phosphorylase [Pediococcus acidilactici NGRI 0510Q]